MGKRHKLSRPRTQQLYLSCFGRTHKKISRGTSRGKTTSRPNKKEKFKRGQWGCTNYGTLQGVGTRHQQKQLVKQKLIRASLTEEGTGINQHSLRAKNGRRTSQRRRHGTGAQVLTPHWAPSPQNVNHSSPSGVCCKEAPPETSRMKSKHLPTEQIPGLSVRGGETTSHIRHRSQSTPHPPLHPETEQGLHSAKECLQHGLPAGGRGQTHGHCKPLGVASQERRWQAQAAPPLIPLWTGNLCPWSLGPVVRAPPFNAGGAGSIPGQSFLPHGQKTKT